MADWKRALLAAVGLLGIAAFVAFVIRPGGFEGQVGWFFGLFPGTFLILTFAHHIRDEVFWPAMVTLNFLWYFTLSFVTMKIIRLIARISDN